MYIYWFSSESGHRRRQLRWRRRRQHRTPDATVQPLWQHIANNQYTTSPPRYCSMYMHCTLNIQMCLWQLVLLPCSPWILERTYIVCQQRLQCKIDWRQANFPTISRQSAADHLVYTTIIIWVQLSATQGLWYPADWSAGSSWMEQGYNLASTPWFTGSHWIQRLVRVRVRPVKTWNDISRQLRFL